MLVDTDVDDSVTQKAAAWFISSVKEIVGNGMETVIDTADCFCLQMNSGLS